MIAFRTPVADCFVFYISRSPNEEVQVSHQGFPYPSTNGVSGPRSTIPMNLFGRYCCRTGRFRPAHSHGTRRKTDHTECAGQRHACALNPGLKHRDKRCRMGKQFRSIDLPPFQGVRNIPIRPNCSHVMMPLIGLHDLVADHASGHDHGHDHPQPLVATKG